MEDKLTAEEEAVTKAIAREIDGEMVLKEDYQEPPVPETIPEDVKAEYIAKTVSDEEFGKFVANRVLDPNYTKREEKE